MRQATDLRGDFVRFNQAIQSHKNRTDCLHRVGGRIHANDCVSATVEKSFKCSQKNSADVVSRVIGLHADSQHATLSHRIAAACDVANLGGSEHQILVAHQLGDRGGDFRNDGLLQRLQFGAGSSVVQDKLAKLPDGHASDGAERFLVECVQNEAGDIVLGRVNQRATDNFPERQVCKFAFRRNALSFRSCGDAGQLVARLFLVSLGKKVAEIGKVEALDHGVVSVRRHHVTEKVVRNGLQFAGQVGPRARTNRFGMRNWRLTRQIHPATSAEWTLNTWLYFRAAHCPSPGQTRSRGKSAPKSAFPSSHVRTGDRLRQT